MNTDSATLARLADVLAGLYPEKASVRRVALDAKLDAGAIDFDQGIVFVWYNALRLFSQKAEAVYQIAVQEFPGNADLETILNPAPAGQPVNLPSIVANHSSIVPIYYYGLALERARSVVLIQSKENGSMATGFLIANNILVTANFVISSQKEAAKAVLKFNFEQDPDGKVETSTPLELLPDEFFLTSSEAMLTAVKVKTKGKSRLKWSALEFSRTPAKVGDIVTLIQHPLGSYKSASSGVVSAAEGKEIRYFCDTEAGSAGAPLFDRNWKVVGMHHSRGVEGDEAKRGMPAKPMMQALGL